jgi:hypothetical protein
MSRSASRRHTGPAKVGDAHRLLQDHAPVRRQHLQAAQAQAVRAQDRLVVEPAAVVVPEAAAQAEAQPGAGPRIPEQPRLVGQRVDGDAAAVLGQVGLAGALGDGQGLHRPGRQGFAGFGRGEGGGGEEQQRATGDGHGPGDGGDDRRPCHSAGAACRGTRPRPGQRGGRRMLPA